MLEPVRGCGNREIGAMYLEGGGLTAPCDRLPFNVDRCPICDQGIKFSRGFTWIHWYHYAGLHENCKCRPRCPICKPIDTITVTIEKNGKNEKQVKPVRYGLMWVGEKYYTPESFISEAMKIGISKRIATLPCEIEFGKTWILLAHKKAGEKLIDEEDLKKIETCSAVFYAFKPRRVVKIITPKQAKDQKLLENLKKRGITPIVGISDGKGKAKKTYELDEWNNKGLLEKLRE